MNNKDKHFKGQMNDEEVIDFFRKHWITLMGPTFSFVLFIAILSLATYAAVQLPQFTLEETLFQILFLLTLTGTAVMTHNYFMRLFEFYITYVIITNHRVIDIHRTLYLTNDHESVYMKRIQDIQKQQVGLFKNILGYGELIFNAFGPDLITIHNVPNPDFHFRLVNRVRNEAFDEKTKEEREVKTVSYAEEHKLYDVKANREMAERKHKNVKKTTAGEVVEENSFTSTVQNGEWRN
ncbi:hypothetical protein GF340_01800 [Candidatus Peregrinibacteria bacterium]|nr:hypothetical protein [Candidatus Peregrinibacteria bacterium]